MRQSDEPIRLRHERREHGSIAWLAVGDPGKLNTLGHATMTALLAALGSLATEDDLRAVVLTGAGERAFIGGADVAEMAGLAPDSARAFIFDLHRCCAGLRDLPVPVIARIQGYALGAGLEIAASCDLRVAAEDAVFGMPEVKLGIPSVIEAALLPGLVGWGRTREILLLGERFTATQAAAWGLVERVVPTAALDAAVEQWIGALLSAGPLAVRRQKQLLRRWEVLPLDRAIAAGVDAFAAAFETEEPGRRMAEFLSRRRTPAQPGGGSRR